MEITKKGARLYPPLFVTKRDQMTFRLVKRGKKIVHKFTEEQIQKYIRYLGKMSDEQIKKEYRMKFGDNAII